MLKPVLMNGRNIVKRDFQIAYLLFIISNIKG